MKQDSVYFNKRILFNTQQGDVIMKCIKPDLTFRLRRIAEDLRLRADHSSRNWKHADEMYNEN
jgi:hypothetical protein